MKSQKHISSVVMSMFSTITVASCGKETRGSMCESGIPEREAKEIEDGALADVEKNQQYSRMM